MKCLIFIIYLCFTSIAWADESRIIETETGYVVEYKGDPVKEKPPELPPEIAEIKNQHDHDVEEINKKYDAEVARLKQKLNELEIQYRENEKRINQ